jgi:methionyl-tRNA formyltransferase
LSQRLAISEEDTGGQLHDRLAALGAQTLADGLGLLRAGMRPVAKPQPAAGATYAHKLDKAEAKLDFTRPASELARKVRAFDPWPVAEAELAGERVRVWAAQACAAGTGDAQPGTLVHASKTGIDIACGAGMLRILKLQRAGGRAIGAADYLNARTELRTP